MGHMDRYYVCGSLMFIAHINVIICHLIALVTELSKLGGHMLFPDWQTGLFLVAVELPA